MLLSDDVLNLFLTPTKNLLNPKVE